MTVVQDLTMEKATLQTRLLLNPRDQGAWQALERLKQKEQSHRAASPTKPASAAAEPSKPARQSRRTGQGTGRETGVKFHGSRPIRSTIAARGTTEYEAAVQQLKEEWLQNLKLGNFARAAHLFDGQTMQGWVQDLDPHIHYQFGYWCHGQGKHGMAVTLLEGCAQRPEAGSLALWANLHGARSNLALGHLGKAHAALDKLTQVNDGHTDPEGEDWEQPRKESSFHALLSLAWLHLAEGNNEAATTALEGLRSSACLADNTAEVDLLSRMLSTLGWLEDHPRQQLSHMADRAEGCGVALALDEVQLSNCGSVLRLQGWVVDPGNQLEHLCLVRGKRVQRLNLNQARHQQRSDLSDVMARCGAPAGYAAGFSLVALYGEEEREKVVAGEGVELFVVLRNGEQFLVRRVPVSCELSNSELKQAVDTVFSNRCELLAPEAAYKLRQTWSGMITKRMQDSAVVKRWGPVPEEPTLSVVVPLYGRIDFMEYQLNWFNALLRREGAEAMSYQLIYVLDDPRLVDAFEALSRRCQALYRMPFETVINPVNLGYAGANNRGVAQARANTLLLLNSDVLPAHFESLLVMRLAFEEHRGRVGALGARLLFDNGGLQHAGMEFTRQDDLPGVLSDVWINDHPMKGLKLEIPERERADLREVEAVTAACLMLETQLYRELGGLSTEFVVGDFEDSELCLRIRDQGLLLLVDLEACFYHLERQSVGHGEHDDLLKTKVVAMNACTQQERWGAAIELLKRCHLEGVA